MTSAVEIGHNNPPDPIEEIRAAHLDSMQEAENWLDGQDVENEDQMKAVDGLLSDLKEAKKSWTEAKELEYRPHKIACDAVVDRYKPFGKEIEDLTSGLKSVLTRFKAKLRAEQEAREREARKEAERKAAEALAAQEAVDMKNIEERREADRLAAEARQAEREAQEIGKSKVKGLRTFTAAEIVDYGACVNWIRENDRDALVSFMDGYVTKATREGVRGIDGVEVRQERRAT